ncbi:FtsX-like permease family protein [Tistrella mobilis]|uniref:FtsX-like permease family protein n=1 Tax=Tistrella mobilis TaxID=171437 RepID=UPI00355912ED
MRRHLRPPLPLRLAVQDMVADRRLSLCQILALAAVLAPLLVLFGLREGVIGTMADRLVRDPANRLIVPVASGGFGADDIAAIAADPRTAFVTPETRAIAAGLARLRNPEARTSISGLAIQPTGQGDPMLGRLPAPEGPDRIVLSRAAAEALQAGPGTALIAEVSRQRGGRFELARLPVTVVGITDGPVRPETAALVHLDLLTATEDFREGLAVPALGWRGDPPPDRPRRYARFRLYASTIYEVEGLAADTARHLGVELRTNGAEIRRMQALDRNLGRVFWMVAGLAGIGCLVALAANLRAQVERKRRDLAVLRLIGFPARALVVVPLTQAAAFAAGALALAGLAYLGLAEALDRVFAGDLAPGERIARLSAEDFGIWAAVTLAAALLAAGWAGVRAAGIAPAEGLRDG